MNTLQFLRLPAVQARTGKSRSAIYRDMRAGQFPLPIRIGLNSVAWQSNLIDDWQAARIQAATTK